MNSLAPDVNQVPFRRVFMGPVLQAIPIGDGRLPCRRCRWNDTKGTWGPKTENSTRTIPLCDAAYEALQMTQVRSEKRAMKSSLVFPGRKGVLNDMRESLNGACARAGFPRIHVHGLRHTFGSQMAMAGAEPCAIMKAMGHADMKTTMILCIACEEPYPPTGRETQLDFHPEKPVRSLFFFLSNLYCFFPPMTRTIFACRFIPTSMQ